MASISFQTLSGKYETIENKIKDSMIQNIYSQINFKYLSISEINANKLIDDKDSDTNDDFDLIESFLIDYLKDYNLIIYHFTNIFEITQSQYDLNKSNNNIDFLQNVDVIICIENECIIIHQISNTIFKSVIKNLKDQGYSILNVTPYIKNEEETIEENQAKEEIKNFCSNIEFKQNKFLELTIYSIAGYYIRRYYYPSEYFKNPSFFSNGGLNKTNEQIIKKQINMLIFPFEFTDFIEKQMNIINDKIDDFNSPTNNKEQQKFNENEFIILRELFVGIDSIFYLVIHRETLYLYTLKRFFCSETRFEHEIEFCKHFSHRCLTHFYGFLISPNKIIGFVYEFMSNGSLDTFITSQDKNKNDELFSIVTIIRLSQGINYLHSNFLILRDLKPSNILLDHDLIPYISDFDRILNVKTKQENEDDEFTSDLGSFAYASPEQLESNNYSYPTDIYSYGKIIYFLFEKKNMNKKSKSQMKNASQIIQNLCDLCIQIEPMKRPTNQEIKKMIMTETNSFDYYVNFFINDVNQKFSKFVQLIFENLLIQDRNNEKLKNNLSYFQLLFLVKVNDGISSLYLNIGNLYFYGCNVGKDDSKAIKYYYMSVDADDNNLIALINLGNVFANGIGVEQDYTIAKSYYERAQEHSAALFNLGYLYFFGLGVEFDIFKAKDYFNSSLDKRETELINTISKKYNYDYKFNRHNNFYNKNNSSYIDNPFSISTNPFHINNPFDASNNPFHINNPFDVPNNFDSFDYTFKFSNNYHLVVKIGIELMCHYIMTLYLKIGIDLIKII